MNRMVNSTDASSQMGQHMHEQHMSASATVRLNSVIGTHPLAYDESKAQGPTA